MYIEMCEICSKAPTEIKCPICSRYVCKKHFDDINKRCIVCRESTCNICRDNLSITRCNICGRRICHYCSIEIDEVRRICFYCIVSFRLK